MNYLTIKRLPHNLFKTVLALIIGGFIAHPLTSSQAEDNSANPAHVIQISVDALGGKYLKAFLEEAPNEFKNFNRMLTEGAGTLNARTDYFKTTTIQNHTSMITGRPVETPPNWNDAKGHYMLHNFTAGEVKRGDVAPESLHAVNPDGKYTYSTFDLIHNQGLSTALYSGKDKFGFYATSYGNEYGEEHEKGRNKIDHVITGGGIHEKAMEDLKANKPAYTFLHYGDPDGAGHKHGYLGQEYRDAVKAVDGYLGDLFALVDNDPEWKDRTVIILSADHGGKPETKGHSTADEPYNYTIPFLVWGKGVAKGADLYELNKKVRTNPGNGRPEYSTKNQPIRNGDGGNLVLKLLGLPAIPGSTINNQQDLALR